MALSDLPTHERDDLAPALLAVLHVRLRFSTRFRLPCVQWQTAPVCID